jgi:hypothetical protein
VIVECLLTLLVHGNTHGVYGSFTGHLQLVDEPTLQRWITKSRSHSSVVTHQRLLYGQYAPALTQSVQTVPSNSQQRFG